MKADIKVEGDSEDQTYTNIVETAVMFYEHIRTSADEAAVNEIVSQFRDVCEGRDRASVYCALVTGIVSISAGIPDERAVGPMIQMLIQDIFAMRKNPPQKH